MTRKPKMWIVATLILSMICGYRLPNSAAQSAPQREPLDTRQGKGRIINSYRIKRGGDEGDRLNQRQGRPDWVNNAARRSADYLEPQKKDLGLEEVNEDVRLLAAEQDDFGKTHLRLRQTHKNIEVFGGQLVSHLEGDKVTSVGGRSFNVGAIDVTPAQSKEQVIETAKTTLGYTGEFATEPSAKLVVLPHSVFTSGFTTEATLTWQVTLHIEDGTDATGMHQFFINAQDGKLVWRYDSMARDGVGNSLYSGVVPVPSVYVPPAGIFGGHYRMVDHGRGQSSVANMNEGTAGMGDIFHVANDVWGNSATSDPRSAAVDAQYGVARAWDYFFGVFSRRGWDNNSLQINSRVHYGSNYNNAFQSGNTLSFGDGDGTQFSPLVSLDVVAHEYTHGLIDHTANLIYASESGAINESFADIFGTAVEFAFRGDANYLIGEQCTTPMTPGDAMRDMANPGVNSYPNRLYQGACTPDRDNNDNCGVHSNSGIMNNVFYLLSEGGTHRASGVSVPKIGRRNAEKIFYRALALYLFPSAKFYDARVATVNAAADYFGANSNEHRAVETAWEAAGVSAPHLYFYQAGEGSGALVRVTQNGVLNQLNGFAPGSFSWGWTDIVPVRNHLFFYNRSNGLSAVAKVDQDGNIATLSANYLPANMNKVVSNDNSIFLYSGATRGGLIAQVDKDGKLIEKQSFAPGTFSFWTNIVDTAYGMFFYDRISGLIAVAHVTQQGQLVQTDGGGKAVGAGYHQVVAQGDKLLLYNNSTGAYAMGATGSDGRFTEVGITICGSGLPPGYTMIRAAGQTLFFYNPYTGAAAVGSFMESSHWVKIYCWGQLNIRRFYDPYNFSPGWSHIVSTANGVFFYNRDNGAAAVGFFTYDGNFIQTAGYAPGSLSLNWSNIITTEQ